MIKEIYQKGTSIILVEHNARMALKLASRAYLLESGQIISQGDAAEVASNDYLRESYLGG